jgi:hypothetical protein
LNLEGKCRLDGNTLNSGKTTDYRPFNYCIENSLNYGEFQQFYFVDPSKYNDSVYSNCDSIEIINKVLKHCILSIDDMKNVGFIVTYP